MADACMEMVRLHDPDRYIATLFAPDEKRPQLFALYAFAIEIARIPLLVSEPQIGEIRLQWWADTVQAIAAGQDVDHPVAQAFAGVVRRHELPVEHIGNMIEARRNDLYADQFASLGELEVYVAETDAALMQFACMVLDRDAAAKAGDAVGLAAMAFGLARVKQVPTGESIANVQDLARRRLVEARREVLPSSLLPAVLPAALTELYLKGGSLPLRRQWTMWRAARRGRI